jgi:hypothetical protein
VPNCPHKTFFVFYCGRQEYPTPLQVSYSRQGIGIVKWYWDCHVLCNNKNIPVTNRTVTYQFCLQYLAETVALMWCLVQAGGLMNRRWSLFDLPWSDSVKAVWTVSGRQGMLYFLVFGAVASSSCVASFPFISCFLVIICGW